MTTLSSSVKFYLVRSRCASRQTGPLTEGTEEGLVRLSLFRSLTEQTVVIQDHHRREVPVPQLGQERLIRHQPLQTHHGALGPPSQHGIPVDVCGTRGCALGRRRGNGRQSARCIPQTRRAQRESAKYEPTHCLRSREGYRYP